MVAGWAEQMPQSSDADAGDDGSVGGSGAGVVGDVVVGMALS